MPIHRITLFKVPDPANYAAIQDLYDELARTAVKDGKPYILSLSAQPNLNTDGARSQGYTFVAQTRFATLGDMEYYDTQCAAHQAFKAKASPLTKQPFEPPLTVFVKEE